VIGYYHWVIDDINEIIPIHKFILQGWQKHNESDYSNRNCGKPDIPGIWLYIKGRFKGLYFQWICDFFFGKPQTFLLLVTFHKYLKVVNKIKKINLCPSLHKAGNLPVLPDFAIITMLMDVMTGTCPLMRSVPLRLSEASLFAQT
jgi:hypothetical protein